MLEQIGDASNIGKFIAKAKDKNDPFRLMGFGHRVYKNYDPRATIIRKMCHKVLESMGQENTPLLELRITSYNVCYTKLLRTAARASPPTS